MQRPVTFMDINVEPFPPGTLSKRSGLAYTQSRKPYVPSLGDAC